MNNDLTLAMRLRLEAAQFGRGLEQAQDKTTRFVRRTEGAFGRWGGTIARSGVLAANGLGLLANRYTALVAGVAGMQAARGVIALDARMTRLGTNAGLAADQVQQLKQRVFEVARQQDVSVNPGQILDAIDAIIEKTGDLQFARDNIRTIGLAIQATGAQGSAIGDISAEFQKMGMNSKEVLESLDLLTAQGKAGAFTLRDLAALGPRVVTAYTALGRTGVPAIREMGAALQMIRMGTGSSEQAATSFENVLNSMKDPTKLKQLRKLGVKVYDEEELKNGREILRPINELMTEIIRKSGGRGTLLRGVFDEQSIKAFNAANAEFMRTGRMDKLDEFYNVMSDGSTILNDAAVNAKTFAAQMERLGAAWGKFADSNLAGGIGNLADALSSLDSETVDRWLNVAKALAGVAAIWGVGKYLKKGWEVGKKGWQLLKPAPIARDAMGVRLGGETFASRAATWGRNVATNPATLLGAATFGTAVAAYKLAPVVQQQMDSKWGPGGLDAEIAKYAARERAPATERFEGSLQIEIVSPDVQTQVRQLRTNSPSLNIDLDHRGPMMVLP